MKILCLHSKRRRARPRDILVLTSLFSVMTTSCYLYHFNESSFINNAIIHTNTPEVCIVGNAETKKHALRIHQMWDNRFRSYWYIWNDDTNATLTQINNIVYLHSDVNLSWTRGIEYAVNVTERAKKPCDYIFTHDDDVTFRARQHNDDRKVSLASMLITLLGVYRPAVASFPWKVGDERFPAMKKLASAYRNEVLAPLTGFDNGMVIYHRSIVRFFIPFPPRGEGGFRGEWTLCAHFLQMFAHLIFGKHAVRLNMFEYDHSINIDKRVHGANFSKPTASDKELAYVSNSRHPYEFPQNEAYTTFLTSGLKSPYRSWGRALTNEYCLETAKESDAKPISFSGLWLLNRLNQVYNIRHEALLNNQLLRDQFTDEQKFNVLQKTDFNLKLILLTMNRPESFTRLWESLMNAYGINRTINIFIHVDMDKNDDKRKKYVKYLRSLRSLHGEVYVVAYSTPRSLKTVMIEAWHPLNNDEYAVFLEDDIEVSPYFLAYLDRLVKAYFYNLKLDTHLFGISLYNQRFNEVIEDYVNVSNDHQLYLYQMPQSWGALYTPTLWRKFLDFFQNDTDPLIPDSYTNRWPRRKSWKKYLLKFMCQQQAYLLYPNFRDHFSLSTNHLEVGLNNKLSKISDKAPMRLKFNVPLLYNREVFEQLRTPAINDLQIYNAYHRKVDSLHGLKTSVGNLASFDKCTMILTVYDRINTTLDRLAHYQNFTYLSAIVVIWNNVDIQPSIEIRRSKFIIPVLILKMKKNSLNNRFYPHKEIQTDCIINMDDDYDMSHTDMAFAIDTWRGHFFNNLVGFSQQGRNHVLQYINGAPTYLYSHTHLLPKKAAFYSIVLPSGFVYHRRYLDKYTFELPQIARDLVDSVQNCDDILFNFLIANTTKQGPVVIAAFSKLKIFPGLWKRTTHLQTRTFCLNNFTAIFNGMPLKYTTSIFKIVRSQTVPGRDKHIFQDRIPINYSCNERVLNESHACAFVM